MSYFSKNSQNTVFLVEDTSRLIWSVIIDDTYYADVSIISSDLAELTIDYEDRPVYRTWVKYHPTKTKMCSRKDIDEWKLIIAKFIEKYEERKY